MACLDCELDTEKTVLECLGCELNTEKTVLECLDSKLDREKTVFECLACEQKRQSWSVLTNHRHIKIDCGKQAKEKQTKDTDNVGQLRAQIQTFYRCEQCTARDSRMQSWSSL